MASPFLHPGGKSMYNTTAVKNPEVCLNMWAYLDEQLGVIHRVAAKGYVLAGTDDEKLAVLHQLAKTDFLSAPWQELPSHLIAVIPHVGNLPGMTTPAGLNDDNTLMSILEEVCKSVDKNLPTQVRTKGTDHEEFCLKIPNEPLYVLTVVVEYSDGRLEPVITK